VRLHPANKELRDPVDLVDLKVTKDIRVLKVFEV